MDLGPIIIAGAGEVLKTVRGRLEAAVGRLSPEAPVSFPDTAYHLPLIYGLTGRKIADLAGLREILDMAEGMVPAGDDIGFDDLLNAGAATGIGAEIGCALQALEGGWVSPWTGPAEDVLLRQRGVEFVDGTAPGFAVVIGALPDPEAAVALATDLQQRSLYTFMIGNHRGESMALQLVEAGVQVGWETRLVPLGPSLIDAALVLGFAVRAAMSFGNQKGGDAAGILTYCRERVKAFILAFGEISAPAAALAVGAMNFGVVTLTDQPLPEVFPPGWDHPALVGNLSAGEMVEKGALYRGIQVKIDRVPIPVPYGSAFEGERIRKPDMYLEISEARTGLPAFEWVTVADSVKDGKVEVIGRDIPDIGPGETTALGLVVRVAGTAMEVDFEPILERQIHRFVNQAQGFLHIGQRDSLWIRVSREAVEKSLRLAHLGTIVHARIHQEYGSIVDAVEAAVITDPEQVISLRESARKAWEERDHRLAGITDEAVGTFYSCSLCQSFAPDHVCVITPERPGLCGAYSWLDGRANHRINPSGPNQPIEKGSQIDPVKGQWEGVNRFVFSASHQTTRVINAYSIMADPMTSCGCFECIAAILPMANGIMIVDRDFADLTPCGMKFSTLAGLVGGGLQNPGFLGHSRLAVASRKFLLAEGGIRRVVWMTTTLKKQLAPALKDLLAEEGLEGFLDQVADETTALTEEEVLAFITDKGHPVLSMDPLL